MKKCCSLAIAMLLGAASLFSASAGTDVLKMTYSTIMVPTDPICKAEHLFVEKVKELSGGKIIIDIYDSAQLYNQDSQLPAQKQGKVDFANIGMMEFDELPYCGLFKSAYIFTSFDHAKRFYTSETGMKVFSDIASKVGIRPLGVAYYGTRLVNLKGVKRDIRTPQDMKGVKLRMPGGADWAALGEALGASPTPVAFNEVYMALKTGTIDGQDNGLSTNKAMSFYEVTDKIIMTEHLVWNLHISINEKRWKSLTRQQQEWIQQAADIAHDYATRLISEDEKSLLAFFQNYGIQIVTPDKKAFVAYAREYYKNNSKVTKNWNWDIYRKVVEMAD